MRRFLAACLAVLAFPPVALADPLEYWGDTPPAELAPWKRDVQPNHWRRDFIAPGLISGENAVPLVELVDQPFVCNGPVNIDVLRVRIETVAQDAVVLRRGCTGRIGRIEVDTWQADGVKSNQQGQGAVVTDLTVEGGYIRCHDAAPNAHQDGVQMQVGQRVTFSNVEIRCGLSNAQFFVSGSTATDVVCDGCNLGPDASHTVNVVGTRNGARNSVLCKPETHRYFTGSGVDEGNERALAGDPRCE